MHREKIFEYIVAHTAPRYKKIFRKCEIYLDNISDFRYNNIIQINYSVFFKICQEFYALYAEISVKKLVCADELKSIERSEEDN